MQSCMTVSHIRSNQNFPNLLMILRVKWANQNDINDELFFNTQSVPLTQNQLAVSLG
jgi:hypothetical protein